ncbi:hypothetical protein EDWATA_03526 [Edwardsiella tarda ATCC 23685]|uniref:Uncharacterized protein n=1 Tax=Edwardsiella tarda ATCC 23685 TaxID=500638 RepID=D4F9R5_EDWTA|nr:hypothetical protein EDWATA_03526 [Edwardsiella tarda ATCC 23685]
MCDYPVRLCTVTQKELRKRNKFSHFNTKNNPLLIYSALPLAYFNKSNTKS